MDIRAEVGELGTPLADEMGFEIVDVELKAVARHGGAFRTRGAKRQLRPTRSVAPKRLGASA